MNLDQIKEIKDFQKRLSENESNKYIYAVVSKIVNLVEELSKIREIFDEEYESERYVDVKAMNNDDGRKITELYAQYDACLTEFTDKSVKYSTSFLQNNHNIVLTEVTEFQSKLIAVKNKFIGTPLYVHYIGSNFLNKIKDIDTYREEAEKILKISIEKNDRANEVLNRGISKEYGKYFDDYSKILKVESDGWLFSIVAISLIILILSLCFILQNNLPDKIDNNILIIYLLPRLSVGFTLFYVLFFAIKNYRSIKHMESVYAQKSKSISTYKDYISLIEDKDIRDTVRKEVAKTIFEIHETGYIKENKDKDNLENLNIADIIRAAKS